MNNTTVNTARSTGTNQANLSPVQPLTTEVVSMKHLIGTATVVVLIVVATVVAGIFDVQQMVQSAEVGQNLIQSLDDQMLLAGTGGNWDGG